MTDEIPLAPVAGWELKTVPSLGAVVLTLQYLVSPMESPMQAHNSKNFAFHTAQLRELAAALIRAADKAESAGMSAPPGPTN